MTSQEDKKITISSLLKQVENYHNPYTQFEEHYREIIYSVLRNHGFTYDDILSVCIENGFRSIGHDILWNYFDNLSDIKSLAIKDIKSDKPLIYGKLYDDFDNKYYIFGAYCKPKNIFNICEGKLDRTIMKNICKGVVDKDRDDILPDLMEHKTFDSKYILDYAIKKVSKKVLTFLLDNFKYSSYNKAYVNCLLGRFEVLEDVKDETIISDCMELAVEQNRLDIIMRYQDNMDHRACLCIAIENNLSEIEAFILGIIQSGSTEEDVDNYDFQEDCFIASLKSGNIEKVEKYSEKMDIDDALFCLNEHHEILNDDFYTRVDMFLKQKR